jgi:hypothetical protein
MCSLIRLLSAHRSQNKNSSPGAYKRQDHLSSCPFYTGLEMSDESFSHLSIVTLPSPSQHKIMKKDYLIAIHTRCNQAGIPEKPLKSKTKTPKIQGILKNSRQPTVSHCESHSILSGQQSTYSSIALHELDPASDSEDTTDDSSSRSTINGLCHSCDYGIDLFGGADSEAEKRRYYKNKSLVAPYHLFHVNRGQ